MQSFNIFRDIPVWVGSFAPEHMVEVVQLSAFAGMFLLPLLIGGLLGLIFKM